MKRALPWVLAGMAAAAGLLALNALEKDVYENGSLVPPPPGNNVPPDDAALHKILPERITHDCPTCGTCEHSLTVIENRRELVVRDHDGWYKLFWAADDVYYFDDPVYLVQALSNSSAGPVQGLWRIKAAVGPAVHPRGAAHACTDVVRGIELDYALAVSDDPAETRFRPSRSIGQHTHRLAWITYHRDRPVSLSWHLAREPGESLAPCSCSGP